MDEFSVSRERIERYLALTDEALAKVEIPAAAGDDARAQAEDMLEMARAYHSDAQHFLAAGRGDDAFAAVNYAHGWLDAGVRLGLLDGKGDWRLFTQD